MTYFLNFTPEYASGLTDGLAAASKKFNQMYKLPISEVPGTESLLTTPLEQLKNLKKILIDEVSEIDREIEAFESQDVEDEEFMLDRLAALADLLADISVFCHTEAIKWGIPLSEVLSIVMDSNESKLGEDGKPIYDETGKVQKGPNYWKPEPKIKELIRGLRQNKLD